MDSALFQAKRKGELSGEQSVHSYSKIFLKIQSLLVYHLAVSSKSMPSLSPKKFVEAVHIRVHSHLGSPSNGSLVRLVHIIDK